MKLEVGKCYRTRDGRKVGPMVDGVNAVLGRVMFAKYDAGECWFESGSYGKVSAGDHLSDIIAEWTAAPEVGTLKEIGAAKEDMYVGTLFDLGVRKGDVVRSVKTGTGATVASVTDNKIYIECDGKSGWQGWLACFHKDEGTLFRIVRRAGDSDKKEGPVRTVTRKEIVPGVYGHIWVDAVEGDWISIGMRNNALKKLAAVGMSFGEFNDMVNTLQAIRDAMQANTTA